MSKKLTFEGLGVEVYRNERTGVLTVDISTEGIEGGRDQWPNNGCPKLRVRVNESLSIVGEDGQWLEGEECDYPELSALEKLADCAE